MKITLFECFLFEQEINLLFKMSLPFPLKFRLETKFVPPLTTAGRLIQEKLKSLAVANGAKDTGNGWEFEKGAEGELLNQAGYEEFLKQNDEFLKAEENSIEIEHTIREELFSGLQTGPGFPSPSIISKFLE